MRERLEATVLMGGGVYRMVGGGVGGGGGVLVAGVVDVENFVVIGKVTLGEEDVLSVDISLEASLRDVCDVMMG